MRRTYPRSQRARTPYRALAQRPRAAYPRRQPFIPALLAGPRRELKSVDVVEATPRNLVAVASVAGASSMATGMTIINASNAGDASFEHIGKNASIQSLALECEFSQPQTDASASTVRLMIVYDRQPNGAYPAIGDLLADNASAPVFNSAINIGYRERFAVLRDCQFTLDTAVGLTHHYETFIKRQLDINYIGTSNAIASVGSGAVYLVCFFLQLLGTTAPVMVSRHSRCRYYDA